MEIREICQKDFPGFCRIMTLFYRYAGNEIPTESDLGILLNKVMGEERNLIFIGAFEGEHLIAIISLTFGESSYKISPFAWCDDLYVDEEFRGRGLGAKLILAAGEIAKEKHCSNVLVGVGKNEAEALSFYKSQGFVNLDCWLLSLPLT